jgi:hypothetical protein
MLLHDGNGEMMQDMVEGGDEAGRLGDTSSERLEQEVSEGGWVGCNDLETFENDNTSIIRRYIIAELARSIIFIVRQHISPKTPRYQPACEL